MAYVCTGMMVLAIKIICIRVDARKLRSLIITTNMTKSILKNDL